MTTEEMVELKKLRRMKTNWLSTVHELEAQVEQLEHKLKNPPPDLEKSRMAGLLETAARNIASVVDQVHQAYHQDEGGSWRECEKGVCGSVEWMLKQCGYDKDFNPIGLIK